MVAADLLGSSTSMGMDKMAGSRDLHPNERITLGNMFLTVIILSTHCLSICFLELLSNSSKQIDGQVIVPVHECHTTYKTRSCVVRLTVQLIST